ncbi:MAG: metallophosphoesterase [Lentisphaeria bacterium]|nr:metallophosphoesterase [Lentisphaeria bacterium]
MDGRDHIFIADSHLREEDSEDFFAMLDRIRESRPAGVVFLGDIFELWIALPGYETAMHQRFLDWCREAKKEFEVGFILGNHEFYVIRRHADAFSWITETEHTLAGGVRCIHGDLINRADWRYLLLRKFLRSGFTRTFLQITCRNLGPAIADYVLHTLKKTNREHKRRLPLTALAEYAKAAKAEKISRIFAGHFHQHHLADDQDGIPLEILPAWDAAGEIVRLTPGLQSECAPWRQILG